MVKITQPVSRFLSYSTEAEMFECHQAMERAVILLESDKSVSMIQTQKGITPVEIYLFLFSFSASHVRSLCSFINT